MDKKNHSRVTHSAFWIIPIPSIQCFVFFFSNLLHLRLFMRQWTHPLLFFPLYLTPFITIQNAVWVTLRSRCAPPTCPLQFISSCPGIRVQRNWVASVARGKNFYAKWFSTRLLRYRLQCWHGNYCTSAVDQMFPCHLRRPLICLVLSVHKVSYVPYMDPYSAVCE